MEILKPSFEILTQGHTRNAMYRHIEKCGRNCWKSEEKTTTKSAKPFVDRLLKMEHLSVLEHGAVYLEVPYDRNGIELLKFYETNPYSKVKAAPISKFIYISTNYRVIIENKRQADMKFMCAATDNHEKRYTVRFICDRRIETEFVRHRTASFSIESTRYVNYNRKGMSFIDMKHHFKNKYSNIVLNFSRIICSFNYWLMTKVLKERPEIARSVLLSNNKADVIMSAFSSDWEHFFKLRNHKAAHPQARELAKELYENL